MALEEGWIGLCVYIKGPLFRQQRRPNPSSLHNAQGRVYMG